MRFRLILAAALWCVAALPAWAVTVERVVSPGGVEAWLVQDHTNPIIALEAAFRGGSATDPQGKAGLAAMVAGTLDEGAGELPSLAYQAKLEDLAIRLSFSELHDTLRAHVKTLTENRDTAFDLLRLALTQPRFDAEPVERVRGQLLAELGEELEDPTDIAERALMKTLFGAHPYGTPGHGTPDTVKAVSVDDLRGFVRQRLARDVLFVSVVGDITPAQLAPLLDQTFGALPAKASGSAVPDVAPHAAGSLQVITRDNPQSTALFALPGIKRSDSQWYAAYVMNYILGGGGFASQLTEQVREKRGLAYSVYSYLIPMDHAGLWQGGVGTRNVKFGESLTVIKDTIARLRDRGPTADELANAKTYLTGSFPLQLDSTSSIAGIVLAMQLDKLGMDFLDRRNGYINAVTLDQVHAAAKRLLDPAALAVVVVGKPEGVAATP